jgi:hypothetical protein
MPAVIRKRDGNRYSWDGKTCSWPRRGHMGDCVHLRPYWDGRSHYKTLAAFLREYETTDGEPITLPLNLEHAQ